MQNPIFKYWIVNQQLSLLNEPVIKKCKGDIIHNTQYNFLTSAIVKSCSEYLCSNFYSIFEVVDIGKKYKIKNSQQYKLEISAYEILQTAEYHFKFLTGI